MECLLSSQPMSLMAIGWMTLAGRSSLHAFASVSSAAETTSHVNECPAWPGRSLLSKWLYDKVGHECFCAVHHLCYAACSCPLTFRQQTSISAAVQRWTLFLRSFITTASTAEGCPMQRIQ